MQCEVDRKILEENVPVSKPLFAVAEPDVIKPFFQKEPSEEWAGLENLIAAQYNSRAEQQEYYRAPC